MVLRVWGWRKERFKVSLGVFGVRIAISQLRREAILRLSPCRCEDLAYLGARADRAMYGVGFRVNRVS